MKTNSNNKLPTITFKPLVKYKKNKKYHDTLLLTPPQHLPQPQILKLALQIPSARYTFTPISHQANLFGSGGTNDHMMNTLHYFFTQSPTKLYIPKMCHGLYSKERKRERKQLQENENRDYKCKIFRTGCTINLLLISYVHSSLLVKHENRTSQVKD